MSERYTGEEAILEALMSRYPALRVCRESMEKAYALLRDMYAKGGCLYIAGNGGSAADSGHIAGELMKAFKLKRAQEPETVRRYGRLFGEEGVSLCERLEGGLPAIPLTELSALTTAIVNDVSGAYIFAQPLNAAARAGDAFWGISTSGNSRDIVNAMMVARAKDMRCIGLTGEGGCRLDTLCDVVIHVPETETFRVQELHLPVYHALCEMLEYHFFKKQ